MKILQSIYFGFSLFLVVYVCTLGIKNIVRYNGFVQEYDKLLLQLKLESRERDQYSTMLAQLKDKTYLEYLIKKRLGYINSDEVVYKFVY